MDEQERDDGLLTPEPEAPDAFVARVTASQNLVPDLSDDERVQIAMRVMDDYQLDKDSMADWLQQMERGIKLATLAKEAKTYPFDGAANVKYPLITSAALQFNARAYPAIVPSSDVVKAKVWGKDPQGTKAARGQRVAEFMSWQLTAKVEEWEPETDKLLTILPIVGEVFRKWWYDSAEGRPRCRLIEPGKLIVNAKVKSLSDAPRLTEELPLYPGEIETRIRSGQFEPFEGEEPAEDRQAAQDFIEQHCRYDLDGDGYEEPYIATVHVATRTLVRMVADFGPEDVQFQRQQIQSVTMAVDQMTGAPVLVPVVQEVATGILGIKRGSYFIDYLFMPAMDGSFHGTGLGLLLGDISEAINSIINNLLDAGHFASLGGGFIGSEFRMKGGGSRFRPGEWKMVTGPGDDVRKALVPMTFPGPDAVMFQMLGMLIEAGREIASVKDVMTGDSGGRQQTATTTLALIEQGMMVFTAAYKRIFVALKREYKLLAKINAGTVGREEYSAFFDGQEQYDPQQDFGAHDMDVEPVADPRSVTKMQMAAKAQLVMQMAEQGLVDKGEAVKRAAEAADIPDFEALLPKPDPMAQQMQQLQMEGAMAELKNLMAETELTIAQIDSERASAAKDLSDARVAEGELRLKALSERLRDDRERMGSLLAASARMAGQPRDAGPQGRNVAGAGAPQGGLGSILPVGPTGFGS